MFKILHTSDWHIGRVLYGRSFLEDQMYFIKNVLIPAVNAENPNLLIIAGDIFDRQIAPVEAIRLFGFAVNEICTQRKIPIIVIAGNHDSADRLSVYADLLRNQGLYISARPFDMLPVTFEHDGFEVKIHLLPHFDPVQARDILGQDNIRSYNEAYQCVLKEMGRDINKKAKNVLVSHCFVKGAATCESEAPIIIGGSAEVDSVLFDGYDYVSLGHLHGAQNAGGNAFYSGAPLKYSFDEEKHKKVLFITEITKDNMNIRRLPCTPLRDMRTISGTIDELLKQSSYDNKSYYNKSYNNNNQDYIFANLTDTKPVFEPMLRLREYYPNILGLNPGWLNLGSITGGARDELRQKLRTRSASEQLFFEEFLKQVCGVQPNEAEMAVFEDVMKGIDEI
jgi:exonuclease SbcD